MYPLPPRTTRRHCTPTWQTAHVMLLRCCTSPYSPATTSKFRRFPPNRRTRPDNIAQMLQFSRGASQPDWKTAHWRSSAFRANAWWWLSLERQTTSAAACRSSSSKDGSRRNPADFFIFAESILKSSAAHNHHHRKQKKETDSHFHIPQTIHHAMLPF